MNTITRQDETDAPYGHCSAAMGCGWPAMDTTDAATDHVAGCPDAPRVTVRRRLTADEAAERLAPILARRAELKAQMDALRSPYNQRAHEDATARDLRAEFASLRAEDDQLHRVTISLSVTPTGYTATAHDVPA